MSSEEVAPPAADAGYTSKGKGKGPAPKGGKGPAPAAGGGKGAGKTPALSYKERQELELRAKEESLSAEESYAGRELSESEAAIIVEGGTDKEEGPYSGRKFLPTRGYFACKRCGLPLYLPAAKFVH